MMHRGYLDWNASAPLHPAARAAMIDALDRVGNPSSQHAEGRAARALIDRARAAVAAFVGVEPDRVIFTSGATEALNSVILNGFDEIAYPRTAHAAVLASAAASGAALTPRDVDMGGRVAPARFASDGRRLIIDAAGCSETGLIDLEAIAETARAAAPRLLDATQYCAKAAFFADGQAAPGLDDPIFVSAATAISAHKIGGPRGVGALVLGDGLEPPVLIHGGGQEFRRRSGTENVAGVAGFGAVCTALAADPPDWASVRDRRDRLEAQLLAASPESVAIRPPEGGRVARLAGALMLATPGWRSDAQLIQTDLAGFAVSAGSACSSGKMTASAALSAMGAGDALATSAIRISFGPRVDDATLDAFAAAWSKAAARRRG